jgi:1,4-alpha-glucan branching enzyme
MIDMSQTKQTGQSSQPDSGWHDAVLRRLNKVREVVFPVHPSQRTGMGAIAYDGGTTFRVWAPHARSVAVTGSFNNWSHYRTPLAREVDEGNGYWSADVAYARPGDEYKFVIRHGRRTVVRTDPYARAVSRRSDNGVIINGLNGREATGQTPFARQIPFPGHTPFNRPRIQDWVIYELHVGTFGENGGVPATFDGVIEKLPYLRDLGINAIELMPVMDFAGEISWGYNPANPFAISPTYGGHEGLARLVQAAHEHGIAVMMDVVYNHFGPQALSLWQFDGWQQHGLGGIYFYNDWRAETPWGHTRPDYGRPEVRQYIRDNALMWLEAFGVDGLRWDATAQIRNARGRDGDPGGDIPEGWALMQRINDELHARYPGAIMVAEDLQNNDWLTRPTAVGGAGFDSQWAADFVHPIRQAIITPEDANRDIAAVARAIAPPVPAATDEGQSDDTVLSLSPFTRVIYTESHDEVANGKSRVPEEIAPGDAAGPFARQRSALGAAMVFTAPGVPLLFQGQEFLEDRWFEDQRPLDWSKASNHKPILGLYRDLIHLRRNLCGTTAGLTGPHVYVYHVNHEDKVIAFHRWANGGPADDVVVVANFANRSHVAYRVGLPGGGRWHVRFRSANPAYQLFDSGNLPEELLQMILKQAELEASDAPIDGLSHHAELALAPYEVAILSQ